MSISSNTIKNKILIAGPVSELRLSLIKKLTNSDFEVFDFSTTLGKNDFQPDHLLFVYNRDINSIQTNSIKKDFEEFLEVAQVIQKPLTLVVNIDPFLEIVWQNKVPVFPQKFSYSHSSDYDSVYPIEKISTLTKTKQIRATVIKVGFLYSSQYSSQKSIIDYYISQAVTKKKIILPHNHEQSIYPSNIEDVGFGVIRSMIGFRNKRNIFIINPNPVSLSSLSKTIQERLYRKFQLSTHIGIHSVQVMPPLKITSKEIENGAEKINWTPKNSLLATIDSLPLEQSLRKYRNKTKINKKKKHYLFSAIGLLLLIVAPILFVVLNTSSAILNLEIAKQNISQKKYPEAMQRVGFSKAKFNRNLVVYNIVNILPGISNRIFFVGDVYHLSLSGVYLSEALESGINIVEKSDDIANILEKENSESIENITSEINLKISNITSSLQLSYLESQKLSGVVGFEKIKTYQKLIKDYSQITQRAEILLPLLTEILGKGENRKYLILNLNNNELRPGGGFIGSYSVLDFTKNKFSSLQVGDIYDIDGQLKQKIPAPAPLVDGLGVESWYLRDANWDPDFKNNYPIIKEFYRKETGQQINGLIAIDLEFIKSILNFTGPIRLDDYNETVSSSNIVELGQKFSEVNFFPGSRQKKNFFSSLSRKLIDQVVVQKKYLDPKFFVLINSSLTTQSMQVAFDNEKIQSALDVLGLTNEVPGRNYSQSNTRTNDYLMVVDANIGANKSNAYVSKKINYTLNLDKNGNLLSEAEIIYKNISPSNSWPAGDYKNYLRVFVPRGSKLEKVTFDGADVIRDFPSYDDGKLTFFAGNIIVPFGSSKSIKFSYTQPKGLDPSQKNNEYYFYYQKQPGTYQIEFNYLFNHPDFLNISSPNIFNYSTQNVSISLTTDVSFPLEFQTNR